MSNRRTRKAALLVLATAAALTLAVTPSAFGWTVGITAQTKLTRTHHWTIQKNVDTPTVTLKAGETANVTYSVTVATTGSTDSGWAVGGNVTFSAAPAFTIGGVQAFATPPGLNTPQTPGTVAGCVPSPFPVTLATGLACTYNIALPNANPGDAHAIAAITASPRGPGGRHVETPYSFANATINHVDECVDVTDSLQGALGTVCVGDSSRTFTYTRTIGPYGEAQCGEHTVPNTATFTTNDTGSTGSDGASVGVTVVCEPPTTGCTRTIGYWKNHAGFGPQADVLSPLLPIWLGTAAGAKSVNVTTNTLAVQLLEMKGTNNVHDSSNGINKLYAQLLGAKLNVESGASASVASTIAAADAFLATHDTLDWAGLSAAEQAQVLSWMSTLDDYNNGLVGPLHCR